MTVLPRGTGLPPVKGHSQDGHAIKIRQGRASPTGRVKVLFLRHFPILELVRRNTDTDRVLVNDGVPASGSVWPARGACRRVYPHVPRPKPGSTFCHQRNEYAKMGNGGRQLGRALSQPALL